MAYESVDKLQTALANEVFTHTKAPKKAAGRALGTLVEIITYYLLKTWGLNNQISIEKRIEEYGNSTIDHNVEFSLHPIVRDSLLVMNKPNGSVTSNLILRELKKAKFDLTGFTPKTNQLLNNDVLRNACTIASSETSYLLCSIKSASETTLELHIYEQRHKLYAMIECKRVGVEEGMNKGPQTIEKAKQGAYVARTASSLQKVRNQVGEMYGIIYKSDGSYLLKPFVELMEEIIQSDEKELLRKFILTVGVVSNHGNWIKKNTEGIFNFSQENFQKELMVLAQSYDWLLFLTDKGLSEFIDSLLLRPAEKFKYIREIFLSSYAEGKTINQFTKVRMNIKADEILSNYFKENLESIEKWFTVISPNVKTLTILQEELATLKNKNWKDIL